MRRTAYDERFKGMGENFHFLDNAGGGRLRRK